MSDILVVGSLAYDTISTPSGKAPRTLGGSANYFSLAASLFAPVKVVGVVGEDYEAKDVAFSVSKYEIANYSFKCQSHDIYKECKVHYYDPKAKKSTDV